jgi:hypothetical protein
VVDVSVIEATVAWIQIHDSRLRSLVLRNYDSSGSTGIVRAEIEARIIDAAAIYAGAASFFNYARRREAEPPRTLSWDAVGAALRNMQFWDDEHPRLYAILRRHENASTGPFAGLYSPTTFILNGKWGHPRMIVRAPKEMKRLNSCEVPRS